MTAQPAISSTQTSQADQMWQMLYVEATEHAQQENTLTEFLHACIIDQRSLDSAFANILGEKLGCGMFQTPPLTPILHDIYNSHPQLLEDLCSDLQAVVDRDSACNSYLIPFLFFKGFQALQLYRAAHQLWLNDRKLPALMLQSRCSELFAVDIHPAADIGTGIMLDHATGIIVGETCVIQNNVSIMQGVTLGGTGKEEGDRHPKIGAGVLLSAGAKVLGNITVGAGAKVGAGSVVLADVPAHTTVAGIPAKVVGQPQSQAPALDMDHQLH